MIVFKLCGRCNLGCNYCYMFAQGDGNCGQPPSPTWDVIAAIPPMLLDQSARTGRTHFELAFHGGEPMLVGKEFFARMMAHFECELAPLDMEYALQTNATLLDAEWLTLLERYGVWLGVSLDGPPGVNGLRRVYHDGRDSTESTLAGVQLLRDSPIFWGVLCVLQQEADGAELISYFRDELGLANCDLLLPDFTHDDLPPDWSAQQRRLGVILCDAFDAWIDEPTDSPSMGCRLFEYTLAALRGERRSIFCERVAGISTIVLETDGTLEPADTLRLCDGFDRHTGIQAGPGALRAFLRSTPYLRALNLGDQYAAECRVCPAFDVCGGGAMDHRYARATGFLNPSVHCKALLQFVDHVRARELSAQATMASELHAQEL